MFGNKKLSKEEIEYLQKSAEQKTTLVELITRQQETMDNDFSSLEDSHKQMDAYIRQVMENVEQVRDYSTQNVDAVAILGHTLDDLCEEMRHVDSDYARITEMIRRSETDSLNAVEQHKHFTRPSKALSELAEDLAAENQGNFDELDRMSELGKQMGVLALNAAIEAGRMGDAGRNFVAAAEEVRNCSREYEQEIRVLKDRFLEQKTKTKELETTISQLIKLLKDNNVAVTKLMRTAGETKDFAEKSAIRSFSPDLTEMKAQLTGVRNLEEEILKSEERNHMQLEDVLSEMGSQGTNMEEIGGLWQQAASLVGEYRQQVTDKGEKEA